MTAAQFRDLEAASLRRGVIDVLLAGLFHWGGIGNYRDMAAAAECLGLEVALHSLYETGVAAANLHFALGLGVPPMPTIKGIRISSRTFSRAADWRSKTVACGCRLVPASVLPWMNSRCAS